MKAAAAAIVMLVLSGCIATTGEAEAGDTWMVTGQVLGLDGMPLGGLAVGTDVDRAATDEEGRFRLAAEGAWDWVQVEGRVRAAFPGHDLIVRWEPADATVLFGGDVMFARSFYHPDWPEPNLRGADARSVLRDGLDHLGPYLGAADSTVVNLETVLGRDLERHPHKQYTFLSDAGAAAALADVGVDVVTLGNNHIVDALAPGVNATIAAARAAGLATVGAGQDLDEAWQRIEITPGVFLRSCVHQWGKPFYDFPAAPGHPGAAPCCDLPPAEDGIEILSAHSDTEYSIAAAPWTRDLAQDAAAAGYDLFLAHGSHVGGGLDMVDGMPVAWGLGNLIFDSLVWPTEFTLMIGMAVADGDITRLWIDPFVRDPTVPYPMAPAAAQTWLRRLAAESGGIVLENGVLELDLAGRAIMRTENITLPAGIHRVEAQISSGVRGFDLAPVAPPVRTLMRMEPVGDAWRLAGVGGPLRPLDTDAPTSIMVDGQGDISVVWETEDDRGEESGALPLQVEVPHSHRLWIDLHGDARITAFDVVAWGADSPWASHVRGPSEGPGTTWSWPRPRADTA